jgi:hypothetical protein
MKIPQTIKTKLKAIENHQKRVKKLLSDIENFYPNLENTCDDSSWNFSSYIDQQGQIYTAKESENLLISFLEQNKG